MGNGEREGIRCPEREDDDIEVTWIPIAKDGGRGEYLLRCPTCGAVNFMLVNRGESERQ